MRAGILALLLVFSGCGPAARYCEQCGAAVTQDDSGTTRFVRGRCVVNGREIDCTHQHTLCPDCWNRR